PETHAIPLLIQTALGHRESFSIFGTDYDTRDGTAVRDYVHVLDLADAHVNALKRLLDGAPSDAFNPGNGTGATVRELIQAVRRVSGRSLRVVEAGRRAGDAPVLVADNAKARRELSWSPRHDLGAVIEHAWAWHSHHEAEVFG